MKVIKLTKGQQTIVDDDVYEWASQYNWYAFYRKQTYYAARNIKLFNGKWRTILLHHCITGHPINNNEIDHKDGNGLNNQRVNLRIVTRRKNGQNLIVHRNGHLVGANWHKIKNKWLAKISINGKRKHLGYFDTEQKAHEAYLKAVEELF